MAFIFCLLALCFYPLPGFAGDNLWLDLPGGDGPGQGKHIVLISGDEEYRSEEALPQLAKILSKHHGFHCTVLFAIDPKDGTINPNIRDNIPGLEQLKSADLMIIFTRFRDLPDEQMRYIAEYIDAGKPVIGLRTATHAFDCKQHKTYGKYTWNSKEWDGGFGRQILGETWISHHGQHGKQGTRGILTSPDWNWQLVATPSSHHTHRRSARHLHWELVCDVHPILRGLNDGDIFGTTDVYGVRLPLPTGCTPLVYGEATTSLRPDSPKVEGKVNDPMMPVAWTKTYSGSSGTMGRVFTTTMGASEDLLFAGTRRMLVNACYWAVGMEEKITDQMKVDLVGTFKPSPFKFNGYQKGLRPSDYRN
jgi:type 1 glutamine amidotransferase